MFQRQASPHDHTQRQIHECVGTIIRSGLRYRSKLSLTGLWDHMELGTSFILDSLGIPDHTQRTRSPVPTTDAEPIFSHLEQHHCTTCHHHNTRKRHLSSHCRSSSRLSIDLYHGLTAVGGFGLDNGLITINDCPALWSVDDGLIAIDDCFHAIRSLFDLLVALMDADDSRQRSSHSVERIDQAAGSRECRASGRAARSRRESCVVSDVDDLVAVDACCCGCYKVDSVHPRRGDVSETHLG